MSELLRATSWPGWWSALLALTLSSGAVLLAVLAADVLLARRVSARWRAALYLAVLVRIALPLGWSSPVGVVSRAAVEAPIVVTPPTSAPAALASVPVATIASLPRSTPPLAWQLALTGALVLAWIVARIMAARSLRGCVNASPRVLALAAGARVVEHASRGPAVFGLLRPRIVLPSALVRRLDDDSLAAVLRHESAHVSRRDPWLLAGLQLITFLAWPLLPAWIAAWRVRGLMEQACDEVALREAGAPQRRAYGEALLQVAEWQPLRARLALGMLAFGGGLAPRLRALRFTRRWPAVAQVALVGLVACGALLASGRRVRADESPAGPIRVPKLAVFRAEVFLGSGEVPDSAVVERVMLVRRTESETDITVGLKVRASAAREALTATCKPVGDIPDARTWVGVSHFVHVQLAPPSKDTAQIFVQFRPEIRDGKLVLGLGQGGAIEGETELRQGEGIVLGGPLSSKLLLTLVNGDWSSGAADIASPTMDLDVDEPLSEVLNTINQNLGVMVRKSTGPDPRISLRLDDVPAERIVQAVADQAGLMPAVDNDAHVLELRAPPKPAPAKVDVEAALRARFDDVTVTDSQYLVHTMLGDEEVAARLKDLDASGVSLDGVMLMFDTDPAAPKGRMLVVLPRRDLTYAVHVDVFLMRRAVALPALLHQEKFMRQVPDPEAKDVANLSSADLVSLREELDAAASAGRGEWLSRPLIFVRGDEDASVSSDLAGMRHLEAGIRVSPTADGLEASLQLGVPESGVETTARGVAPMALVRHGRDGYVVAVVEATPKTD